jgi:hypothetical protein
MRRLTALTIIILANSALAQQPPGVPAPQQPGFGQRPGFGGAQRRGMGILFLLPSIGPRLQLSPDQRSRLETLRAKLQTDLRAQAPQAGRGGAAPGAGRRTAF